MAVLLLETAAKHFRGYKLHDLVSASRTFPITARVDLQLALENEEMLFTGGSLNARLLGGGWSRAADVS